MIRGMSYKGPVSRILWNYFDHLFWHFCWSFSSEALYTLTTVTAYSLACRRVRWWGCSPYFVRLLGLSFSCLPVHLWLQPCVTLFTGSAFLTGLLTNCASWPTSASMVWHLTVVVLCPALNCHRSIASPLCWWFSAPDAQDAYSHARTTCFLLVWPCVVEHSSCRHQRSWLDTLCLQAAAEDILVWHLILSWLVAVCAFVTI